MVWLITTLWPNKRRAKEPKMAGSVLGDLWVTLPNLCSVAEDLICVMSFSPKAF